MTDDSFKTSPITTYPAVIFIFMIYRYYYYIYNY